MFYGSCDAWVLNEVRCQGTGEREGKVMGQHSPVGVASGASSAGAVSAGAVVSSAVAASSVVMKAQLQTRGNHQGM